MACNHVSFIYLSSSLITVLDYIEIRSSLNSILELTFSRWLSLSHLRFTPVDVKSRRGASKSDGLRASLPGGINALANFSEGRGVMLVKQIGGNKRVCKSSRARNSMTHWMDYE